jgi:Uncharacterized protein conserved in archaea (DUF2250).
MVSEACPTNPREASGLDPEAVHRALRRVGLVTEYEGSRIKASERKLKPKDETPRKHTYHITTDRAERMLRELDDD